MLLQDPDDLLFREPCLLHRPSLLEGGLYSFLEVIQGLRSSPQRRSGGRRYLLRRPPQGGRQGLPADRHPYELFLQLEGIEHRKTKVRRPQSNGIVERFHRTLLDEHFRVEGRRTWFETVEQMQEALDTYLVTYNNARPHQGRGMNGRTPGRAFLDRIPANDNPQEDSDRNIEQTEAA